MKEFIIYLNTVERVNDFVKIVSKFEQDMDIIVGRYIIDAKSIMGIFSIDLTRPLTLRINSDDVDICKEIKEKLERFIVEGN